MNIYCHDYRTTAKPIITIEESPEVFIEVGLSPTFTCSVVALPPPVIEWRKNGTVLSASKTAVNNVKVEGTRTTFVLMLSSVEIEDTGNYTCYAQNDEGESMTNVKLNVARKFRK